MLKCELFNTDVPQCTGRLSQRVGVPAFLQQGKTLYNATTSLPSHHQPPLRQHHRRPQPAASHPSQRGAKNLRFYSLPAVWRVSSIRCPQGTKSGGHIRVSEEGGCGRIHFLLLLSVVHVIWNPIKQYLSIDVIGRS